MFTLDVPSFVIVAGDDVGSDAGTAGVFGDEVFELGFEAVLVDVELIEAAFAVNPVAGMIDGLDAFALKAVVEGFEDVEALIFGAEVGIGDAAEGNLGFGVFGDVNAVRGIGGLQFTSELEGVVELVNGEGAVAEVFDGGTDFIFGGTEHAAEIGDVAGFGFDGEEEAIGKRGFRAGQTRG
jgi:hypothetical protein